MPVRVDATSATNKWVARLSAATTDITNGVNRVSRAPGQAAVAQKAKWLANVQSSADKWARNTGRVSLDDWKNSMTTVGIPRIAQGASAKQGKMQAFMNEFLPFLERGVAQVNAMPSTTFEENVARAVAMMRYNRGFRRGGSA